MAVVLYGADVVTNQRRVVMDPDDAIDEVDVDWMFTTLLKEISKTRPHYDRIRKYIEGDPPKPETPSNLKEAWVEFETFRKKSRTNFAGLIVGACVDRTIITGFRTAAQGDDNGDEVAEALWDENDMDVLSDEVHQDVFGYGRGYLLADPFSKRARRFRPWQAMSVPDTNGDPVIAVNFRHDPVSSRDIAQLWTREVDENGVGQGKVSCHFAVRDRKNKPTIDGTFSTEVPLGTYISRNWKWWKTKVTTLDEIPLIEFQNRNEDGEFEKDTDVLDRINHMILQRVVIITMQAFRQRAVQGNLPTHDDKGKKINYDELFPASPGALWLLGPEAEMWESAPTSVQDILGAVKDDVRDLAAVTRTPMTYFSPDSANGSAEGATLQREGYTSKINDRKARLSGRWRKFMSLMFTIMDTEETRKRAAIGEIEVLWTPTDVLSMTERYSAGTQAKGMGMSLATVMREVLHFTPKQMRAAELERISESLKAALTPAGSAGAQQTPLNASRNAQNQLQSTNGATSRATGVSR